MNKFTHANERDLINALHLKRRPVVFWLGAGASAQAKLPSWSQLREELENNVLPNGTPSLNEIKAEKNNWSAFSKLKTSLGNATFNGIIKSALNPSYTCDIPEIYKTLWRLDPQGVITLNIDVLASRSYSASGQQSFLIQSTGKNLGNTLAALSEKSQKFIANVHGSLEDEDSWVFTENSLRTLFEKPEYNEFVRDCIKYTTIIFIGITASDEAVIKHFITKNHELGCSSEHFWITNIDEEFSVTTAENNGIRVINYNSESGHHYIRELIEQAIKPNHSSDEALPIIAQKEHLITTETNGHDLTGKTPNEIRELLNKEASTILKDDNPKTLENFSAFCQKNAIHIHTANFLDSDPANGADKILGFSLSETKEEGGFSKVWKGYDADGIEYAIKLFKHDIRKNKDLLSAFRRGVRSMRLLNERKIDGVVKFVDATEIPPVVIMEWVEGVTLHKAIKSKHVNNLEQVVSIAAKIANIIYSSHSTLEAVVHRDIRPQNIMIRDFWNKNTLDAEVVVLDFDLSWHQGALERSVYISGGTAYLAPEQITETHKSSTKNATVDSFGFGMTLYFMLTEEDPVLYCHAKDDWASNVRIASKKKISKEWTSAGNIIYRIIKNSTQHQQKDRMLFSQVTLELEKLEKAIKEPENVTDLYMICEEVLCRTKMLSNYSAYQNYFEYQSPSGVIYKIEPNKEADGIIFTVGFTQTGNEAYSSFKDIDAFFKKIHDHFSDIESRVLSSTFNSRDFLIRIELKCKPRVDYIQKLPLAFDKIAEKLSSILSR